MLQFWAEVEKRGELFFRTEHPREINALQRFNIYQEVFLAYLYRSLMQIPIISSRMPVATLFYVYSCFAFAGLGVSALFILAWKLTKK